MNPARAFEDKSGMSCQEMSNIRKQKLYDLCTSSCVRELEL
jgi:hypothetical protein